MGALSPELKKTIKGFESPPADWNDESRETEMEIERQAMERRLVRKVDLRLCTIAGILCSLNLLDSGIISSASVTSIFGDLGMGGGNRYVSFFLSVWMDCGYLVLDWRRQFC